MLYPSMMFRLNGIDPQKAGDAWRTIPALMEKAEASGTHHFPRKAAIVRPQRSQIEWRVNFTQLAREDGTAINGLEPDDLTRGEIDGRRQAVNAFDFLRTVPGFEKSYIVDLPPQLGSAKPAVSSAATCSQARMCSAAPRSATRSASTAGRWNPISRAM